jgi:hypothetical protein
MNEHMNQKAIMEYLRSVDISNVNWIRVELAANRISYNWKGYSVAPLILSNYIRFAANSTSTL